LSARWAGGLDRGPPDVPGVNLGGVAVGSDPVEAEHSGITSDATFGLSVVLITLSGYWTNRWLNREWLRHARGMGLAIRPESTTSKRREGESGTHRSG
jgi:hypothetical protein